MSLRPDEDDEDEDIGVLIYKYYAKKDDEDDRDIKRRCRSKPLLVRKTSVVDTAPSEKVAHKPKTNVKVNDKPDLCRSASLMKQSTQDDDTVAKGRANNLKHRKITPQTTKRTSQKSWETQYLRVSPRSVHRDSSTAIAEKMTQKRNHVKVKVEPDLFRSNSLVEKSNEDLNSGSSVQERVNDLNRMEKSTAKKRAKNSKHSNISPPTSSECTPQKSWELQYHARRSTRLVEQESLKDYLDSIPDINTPVKKEAHAKPLKVQHTQHKKKTSLNKSHGDTGKAAKKKASNLNHLDNSSSMAQHTSKTSCESEYFARRSTRFVRQDSLGDYINSIPDPVVGTRVQVKEEPCVKSRNKRIKWEDMYEQLVQYQKEHGSITGITGYLGKWTNHQRAVFNKNKLPECHVARLKKLGFNFARQGNQFQVSWEERFEELCAYKEKYGHCNVENKDVPRKASMGLVNWVQYQRKRVLTLTPDQKHLLTSLGFRFSNSKYTWDAQIERLEEYKSKYGHCNVPTITSCNTNSMHKLSVWAKNQRKFYKNGKLSEERIKQLKGMGFRFKKV
jgi:hypothetical protein